MMGLGSSDLPFLQTGYPPHPKHEDRDFTKGDMRLLEEMCFSKQNSSCGTSLKEAGGVELVKVHPEHPELSQVLGFCGSSF